MTVLLAFLSRAWPYILGLILLGIVVYKADHWCNSVCKDARAELVEAKAAIQRAKDAAAAIAVQYGQQVEATQRAEAQRDGERNARFLPVEAAARNLPVADARVRIPASAVGVLDDAIRAGNARLTEPAAGPAEEARAAPADSNVASLTAWGVACAKQYAELADQVLGWQEFYAGLQRANERMP